MALTGARESHSGLLPGRVDAARKERSSTGSARRAASRTAARTDGGSRAGASRDRRCREARCRTRLRARLRTRSPARPRRRPAPTSPPSRRPASSDRRRPGPVRGRRLSPGSIPGRPRHRPTARRGRPGRCRSRAPPLPASRSTCRTRTGAGRRRSPDSLLGSAPEALLYLAALLRRRGDLAPATRSRPPAPRRSPLDSLILYGWQVTGRLAVLAADRRPKTRAVGIPAADQGRLLGRPPGAGGRLRSQHRPRSRRASRAAADRQRRSRAAGWASPSSSWSR